MKNLMLPYRCARLVTVVSIAFGSVGCASTRPWTNEPLAAQETVRYDGWAQLFDASRLPDVLVVANFSGGNSRAAAFAHAAISELDAAPFLWRGQETTLFKGSTFGQLAQRPGRPYLIIGATDLSTGAEFNFTSDRLALLCSSIDRVPLAVAVASSSAVPVLFSPLTLRNHSQSCAQPPPKGPGASAVAADPARVRLQRGEFESIADGRRPFIHLVDGGVSDNLGTRRLTDCVAKAGGIGAVMSMLGRGQSSSASVPRRIVLISVNSESNEGLPIDCSGTVPGTVDALSAMILGGLGRFSKETSLVFSDAVEQWRRELRSAPPMGRGVAGRHLLDRDQADRSG